jgi:pimeloyl-ACP methyl ester carboxylesterase
VRRRALEALLYFPERALPDPPHGVEDVWAGDVHGWFFRAHGTATGHVLFCHGNGGNIGDRIPNARLLVAAGFDVLLFDYRGYGRSPGRATEEGTYEDARAARAALVDRVGADRVLYVGESLGGAVAMKLAHEQPPAGLVLQSTFTSVRDMAAVHYRVVPSALVPDAYPSLSLVAELRTPLLVLHGERDDIVPASNGRALYDAAPEPKRLHLFPEAGHNDLIAFDGDEWAAVIREWWLSLPARAGRSGRRSSSSPGSRG